MQPYLIDKHTLRTLAALVLAGSIAQAGPVTYQAGDLFLGVRALEGDGATLNYVVNIGQAATYRDATSGFVVTGLGSIGEDLKSIFGPEWFTRPDVLWSISGTSGSAPAGGDPARTLYATRQRADAGRAAELRHRANSAAQAAPTNKLTSLAGAYAQKAGTANTSTASSPVAIVQTTSDTNSYSSFQTASSYRYFSTSIESSVADGAAGLVLDLHRLTPAGGATGVPVGSAGDLVGSFSLSTSGTLTFSKQASIPHDVSIVHHGSSVELTFRGDPNLPYLIRRSLDLITWVALDTVNANPTGLVNFTDSSPPPGQAYYRPDSF